MGRRPGVLIRASKLSSIAFKNMVKAFVRLLSIIVHIWCHEMLLDVQLLSDTDLALTAFDEATILPP